MAQWTVTGADATTGEEKVMAVTADDEKGAAKAARERGIFCTEAKRVSVEKPKRLSASERMEGAITRTLPTGHKTLAIGMLGMIVGCVITSACFVLTQNHGGSSARQEPMAAEQTQPKIGVIPVRPATPSASGGQSSGVSGGYVYQGIARSQAWFDDMYQRHGRQIVRDGGKFYDVGKALSPDLTTKLPDPIASAYTQTDLHRDFQVGDFCCCGPEWKVSNVINDHELLAFYPPAYGAGLATEASMPPSAFNAQREGIGEMGERMARAAGSISAIAPDAATEAARTVTLTIHIGGFDTGSLVDNQDLRMGAYRLVYVGNYKRGGSTVRNFVVYTPASRRDFADALASGLILKE